MKGMAYRFSLGFNPGVMNRQSSHKQHRRGQEQPSVGGDLDPKGQAVQRAR